MVIDLGYWNKVIRRILILFITILGIYLAFKLAVFYLPFLIAFIISIMIEPLIKFTAKKTKFTRKTSAIIILVMVSVILVGLLVWGITSLISEASNLLMSLNEYFEKAYFQIQNFISKIDFSKIQLSDEVNKIIQESTYEFLGAISNWLKNGLTSIMNGITSIPTVAIYVVISLLSTYFICTDKLYMLDQIEHHLPKAWVRKIGIHLREIISTLGGYLKAQVILIVIAFVIVLVGLCFMSVLGFNVKYPLLAALGIGFIDALPILGSGTAMIPWAVISALNGDISLALVILLIYAIILITRQFLEPKIVSKHIGIHPIFTLIAMYTGYRFIGILGMLIGPIILIILKNIFATMIDKGVAKAIFDRR